MRWPRILYMRCRSLFGRPRLEDELSDELRFHLQEQIQENLAAGMLPDEARRAALADIGGLDQVKEACRDSRGVTLVENAWRDLRYAWRGLARTPAFMAVAILSLALSIGANTAIFSFLNAVLLKALPVSEPHRLVIVTRHVDQYGWDTSTFNYPMYREFAVHRVIKGTGVPPVLVHVAGYDHQTVRLRNGEGLQQHRVQKRKYGRVRTDAQGQRENGDGHKCRGARQPTPSVTQIAPGIFDERHAARIAAGFLHLIETADVRERGAAGFVRQHAGGQVLLDLFLQVEAEFIGQLVFEAGAAE